MNENTNKDLSRRNFLFQGGKSLAAFAAANVGVYVIGSAFKSLDGSLVAGAKCDGSHFEGQFNLLSCSPPSGGWLNCQYTCVGSSWFCAPQVGCNCGATGCD